MPSPKHRQAAPMTARIERVVTLRDAALTLLRRSGKRSSAGIGFEESTPQNPEPRISLHLRKHPLDGRHMLSVWASVRGKHGKVLNVEWLGREVVVVSFRRGEWETELLAMGRSVAVH